MKSIFNKKSLLFIIFIIIFLLCFNINPTFAKFINGYTTPDEVVGINFDFDIGISNIEEYNEVSVVGRSSEVFNIEIENSSANNIYYGIWYKFANDNIDNENVRVAKLLTSQNDTSGSIDNSDSIIVSIIVINNSNYDVKINFGVLSSNESVDKIEYLDGRKLVSGTATEEDASIANSPNLIDGMIPVYYDESNNSWKKADRENLDNTWYNYKEKIWANAVIVSNETKNAYMGALNGTVINSKDIVGFYVWIPRFKYRLFNITKNINDESVYTYNAYSKGIDIIFEGGNNNTGNLTCTYYGDEDSCIYNGSTIEYGDKNSDYSNVWYTHPAFTFGNREITGFWVGKFETGGTDVNPVILPDTISLRNQVNYQQFITSRKFDSYGINSGLDSHVMKNIEWGAVSYLTYSLYGLCDDNGCRSPYINNSGLYYSGRSAGNSYSDSKYGNYSYDGYKINDDGTKSQDRDMSMIASNTGNIYGIYDLVGGASESIMANSNKEDGNFNVGKSLWSDNAILDYKYYDSYSFSKYNVITEYNVNKMRYGDGILEFANYNKGNLLNNNNPWLIRGSNSKDKDANIFSVNEYNGDKLDSVTFRSVLS